MLEEDKKKREQEKEKKALFSQLMVDSEPVLDKHRKQLEVLFNFYTENNHEGMPLNKFVQMINDHSIEMSVIESKALFFSLSNESPSGKVEYSQFTQFIIHCLQRQHPGTPTFSPAQIETHVSGLDLRDSKISLLNKLQRLSNKTHLPQI